MILLLFFSRRVNLNNKVLREVNKKTEVKKQKDLLKNGKRTRKDEEVINYPSNCRKLGIITSSSRSGQWQNKGKYIKSFVTFLKTG